MLLKKQTVWLLTMLSLIIVLSVYYITSPSQSPSDLAAYQNEDADQTAENAEDSKTAKKAASDGVMVSDIKTDDTFVALRMQIEEERAEMAGQLRDLVASSNVSDDMKAQAFAKVEALGELSQKERILESLIAGMGYEDVLVNTMDDVVEVIVKSKDKLTNKDANDIMVKTREELGQDKQVSVKYYATAKK